MDVDVVTLLRELDFSITAGASEKSWLLRSPDGQAFLVEPTRPVERVTSHVVRNAKAHHPAELRPLLVGRSATTSMLEQAKDGQVDVLLEEPLQLILHGTEFTVDGPPMPTTARRRTNRPAWILWAVGRCLILAERPMRQTEIADLLGTSQQAVSNAYRQLGSLVSTTKRGVATNSPKDLLEQWQVEYAGPGGQEFGWYSLDPIVEQTLKAANAAKLFDVSPLISGDVAADRLAPWKLPSRGRIYVNSPIDLIDDGFVPAPLDEATLVTCVPRDPTLWRLTGVGSLPRSDGIELADPAVVYWDVLNSGDVDNVESASHLERLITESIA